MSKLMLMAGAVVGAYLIGARSRSRWGPGGEVASKARRLFERSGMRDKAAAAADTVETAGTAIADRVSSAASYASGKITSAFDTPEGAATADRA